MNRPNPEAVFNLETLIDNSGKIAIAVHLRPDGDALGSGCGMLAYLVGRGKDAVLLLPNRAPESLTFIIPEDLKERVIDADSQLEKAMEAALAADLLICEDFNAFHRTGELCEVLKNSSATKVLIDHHLNPEREYFKVVFSEPDASSTAELLYSILLQMPEIENSPARLPMSTRYCLMTGMTTDTNNFGNSTTPNTLRMAADLIETGVDREDILYNIYKCGSENKLRIKGHLLQKMEITPEKLAYIILDKKTFKKFNIKDGDTEGFVNEPLAIKEVKASIFLTEDDDKYRVSIRSKKGVSAVRMANLYFNGGGHEQASGGKLPFSDGFTSEEAVVEHVLKCSREFFNDESKWKSAE